jgi:leucyl aminopeptidase
LASSWASGSLVGATHPSKPGDIVTALDGATIEVNNTDAEGRLLTEVALSL